MRVEERLWRVVPGEEVTPHCFVVGRAGSELPCRGARPLTLIVAEREQCAG